MTSSTFDSATARPSRIWPRSRALLQLENGAPRDDFAAVPQERIEHLLQIQQARLAIDQRDHVDAEAVLHLRLLVEIVEDDLRLLRRASAR